MRSIHLGWDDHSPNRQAYLVVALVLTLGVVGCASDSRTTAPLIAENRSATKTSSPDENAIVVSTSAELLAALVPENAGRRIHLRAGSYDISQPLFVPDGTTLEGEGVMLQDDSGLPTGFDAGTGTTLTMTANVLGDVLTLGNGAAVRGVTIVDLAGRAGNAIAVLSRAPGDHLSATIADVEIVNPNAHGAIPSGPKGCGVAVVSLNPNLGNDPPPHTGAAIAATITHSLIRTPATGTGCGLFALNFAPEASIAVTLTNNVIGGGIVAAGGVSRTDAVHDSRTTIQSHHNLYRDDSPDPCVSRHLGWNLLGGAGTPIPLLLPETKNNALSVASLDDRLEGFALAVFAAGGRRFFASPTAGPTTGNSTDLELIGTTISTPSCGAPSVDFQLAGAQTANASLVPGDGNTLHAVIRGVTASGVRANLYADVLGPTGPLPAALQGTGNRLEIVGSVQSFTQTNQAIDPAPGAAYFTSGN